MAAASSRRTASNCARSAVTDAKWEGDRFHVSMGAQSEDARFLLIATGVVDDLPAVSGLDECYGRSVFHCPYCDGWEWRDRKLAVLGRGQQRCGHGTRAENLERGRRAVHQRQTARALRLRDRLARNDIAVKTAPVARLDHSDGRLSAVALSDGELLARDALFFHSGQHPQSDLAARLGCTLNRRGTVNTGSACDTNVPNVFVAGDASRDAQFVVIAAAEGVKAAVTINKALQRQELVP